MVQVNRHTVEEALARRGWTEKHLIPAMDCAENTVRNMMDGGPVSHTTQVKLFNAFDGHIPFADLFVVTAGEQAETEAVA